jgi:rubredoxin
MDGPVTALAPLLARDHECDRCGYQIAVEKPPPVCPMCGRDVWSLIAKSRQSTGSMRRAKASR